MTVATAGFGTDQQMITASRAKDGKYPKARCPRPEGKLSHSSVYHERSSCINSLAKRAKQGLGVWNAQCHSGLKRKTGEESGR